MQCNTINGAADLETKGMMKAATSGLMVPSIFQTEQGTKPVVMASNAQFVPALLLELVTTVSQIAQLDAMFQKVKASAPTSCSEADKWHQVSVQALETSRKYMVEQQASLIQRIANATGTPLLVQNNSAISETKASDKEDPTAEGAEVALPPGLEMSLGDDTQATANSESQAEADGNSLRNYLEKIKSHTPGCALLIRKIKPLGFESAEYLRAHCEKFGDVAEVLVSHCITKPSPKRAKGRIRPAALGFVVMASPEDADAVFAYGEMQHVAFQDGSVLVEVQRFREFAEDIEETGAEAE